uniref:Galanin peptides n=1 Tax=Equus caballus TaxID=9796 RepID=F6YII8_HORSE
MPRGCALLLASLLLAAALSAAPGLGSPVKEKRGWTLNSAGYLLGPQPQHWRKNGASARSRVLPEVPRRMALPPPWVYTVALFSQSSVYAIDNHRSFHDKHGLAGKRELQPEDEARPGSYDRPLPENNVVRTIIEFLNFLHLKEAGALERLPDLLPVASTEDTEQA